MKRLALLLPLLSTLAYAEDEPTAADVAGAPAAGTESGRTDEIDESDGAGRWVARGLLFVPRVAVTMVMAPVEGGAWAIERYQLLDRAQQLFFNDAGTFGIVPTFQLESGFGLNLGARVVHRDLFGAKERFDLRTSGGGRFNTRVATELSSGKRFDRVSLHLGGEFEKRPKDPYYGVGNDEMSPETRFRQRILRGTGTVDVRVASAFRVLAAGAITDRIYDRSDTGDAIDEVYMDLPGYEGGVRNTYGELELRWDSRGRARDYEPISVIATGQLLAVFAGRVTALDDSKDFWRYGVDAQRFFRLGPGPRVLSIRSHTEAVTGDLDELPFNELPRLGGKDVLRGYASDRFRDRIAMVSSVDYSFDLAPTVSATLFVDAGRVQRSFDDLEISDLRVGYGLQLDLHTSRSFLARASIASSKDGGVFFNLGLDPVFELDGRVERR
jgi:hypothetical protein